MKNYYMGSRTPKRRIERGLNYNQDRVVKVRSGTNTGYYSRGVELNQGDVRTIQAHHHKVLASMYTKGLGL